MPGKRITVVAVGDTLLHAPLQRRAEADESGWKSLWQAITPWIESADMAYANLEGASSCCRDAAGNEHPEPAKIYDDEVYTGFPHFNYHPSLLEALAETGFDVVSTANNHAMDRGSYGVDETARNLEAAGLQYTGTRAGTGSGSGSAPRRSWYTIVEAEGFRIAWLACTDWTNGPVDDPERVLYCGPHEQLIRRTIRKLTARADVDAVFVAPHGGTEYAPAPCEEDVERAHRFLEAGALVVLTNHPHVVQGRERYVTSDGRETFVHYSLGNFVSNQGRFERRTGILLFLGLTRSAEDGLVYLSGVRYLPVRMLRAPNLQLELLDAEPSDERALLVSRLGAGSLHDPYQVLDEDTFCAPEHAAPVQWQAWIGDACREEEDCAPGLHCRTTADLGFCTTLCGDGLADCPVRRGRRQPFCAELGEDQLCAWSCEEARHCREGFTCADGACLPGG